MCQCNGMMEFLSLGNKKRRFQIWYIGFSGKNDPLKSLYYKEKQFEVIKFRPWVLTSHQNIMWFQCISTFLFDLKPNLVKAFSGWSTNLTKLKNKKL